MSSNALKSEIPTRTGRTERRDPKRTRSRTIPMRRMSRDEIAEGIRMVDEMDYRRPSDRKECVNGVRPCPYVSCQEYFGPRSITQVSGWL